MDKVTRQCPQTTTFLNRKERPKRYRTEVLPLTNLTPYRQAKPAHRKFCGLITPFYITRPLYTMSQRTQGLDTARYKDSVMMVGSEVSQVAMCGLACATGPLTDRASKRLQDGRRAGGLHLHTSVRLSPFLFPSADPKALEDVIAFSVSR